MPRPSHTHSYIVPILRLTSTTVPSTALRFFLFLPLSFSTGVPLHHSLPGAGRVLYLDFDGHSNPASNKGWGAFEAQGFDPNQNGVGFDADELMRITLIWQRVAEDYSPFAVDVTTEKPSEFNTTVAHCIITSSTAADGSAMPHSHAAGVAYIGIFNNRRLLHYSPAIGRCWYSHGLQGEAQSYARAEKEERYMRQGDNTIARNLPHKHLAPLLVYYDNLLNGREDYVAEATSHEFGHVLGLSHDGTANSAYFSGNQGTPSPTSFAPIMGTGYKKSLTQWSNGNYADADNLEDDVAILRRNLLARPDEDADSLPPVLVAPAQGGAATVQGVIGAADDVDVWPFLVEVGGIVTVIAEPWTAATQTNGGNLDVLLRLRDARGRVLEESNPADAVNAGIRLSLTPGTYYAEVDGTAAAAATVTTDYGSLGQYALSLLLPLPECRTDDECSADHGCRAGHCESAITTSTTAETTTTTTEAASTTTAATTTLATESTVSTTTAASPCVDDVFRGNAVFERAATLSLDDSGVARVSGLRVCPPLSLLENPASAAKVNAAGDSPADWYAVPLCAGQLLEIVLEYEKTQLSVPLLAVWGVTRHAQAASRHETNSSGSDTLHARTDASASASFSYLRVSSSNAATPVTYNLVLTANQPCSVGRVDSGDRAVTTTAIDSTTTTKPTTTVRTTPMATTPTTTIDTTTPTTISTTATTSPSTCECDGRVSNTRNRNKREYINFARTCQQGHVLRACVVREEDSEGDITVALDYLTSNGKWKQRAADQVPSGKGNWVCLTYAAPPGETTVNDRFSIKVQSGRETYTVRYDTKVVAECNSAE